VVTPNKPLNKAQNKLYSVLFRPEQSPKPMARVADRGHFFRGSRPGSATNTTGPYGARRISGRRSNDYNVRPLGGRSGTRESGISTASSARMGGARHSKGPELGAAGVVAIASTLTVGDRDMCRWLHASREAGRGVRLKPDLIVPLGIRLPLRTVPDVSITTPPCRWSGSSTFRAPVPCHLCPASSQVTE
jgi:hypothetical protein